MQLRSELELKMDGELSVVPVGPPEVRSWKGSEEEGAGVRRQGQVRAWLKPAWQGWAQEGDPYAHLCSVSLIFSLCFQNCRRFNTEKNPQMTGCG